MTRLLLILICCFSLTGCQQSKSFLHMNSDSPSPFFGLQLAVDAKSPAVQMPPVTKDARNRSADFAGTPARYLAKARTASNVSPKTSTTSQPQRTPDFKFTAAETAMSGDLKMALPKSKPKSGSPEADQLADLLHRLKRS